MKTKILIVIIVAVICIAGTTAVFAYREEARNKKKSAVEKVDENKVKLAIPEETTKLVIVDGTQGDSIVIDDESISQFDVKLGSVSGVARSIGEFGGYTYGVKCYQGEELIASFMFMSDCIVNESIGSDVRQITMDSANPAFAYIEELFEELRPKN